MLKIIYITILSFVSLSCSFAQQIKWVAPKDNSCFEIISCPSYKEMTCRSVSRSYLGVNKETKDTFQIIIDLYEPSYEVGDVIKTSTLTQNKRYPDIRIFETGFLQGVSEIIVSKSSSYPCFWANAKLFSRLPKTPSPSYLKGLAAIESLKNKLKK